METDLAILGIEIRTQGLDKTLKGLDTLSIKSREVEKSLRGLQLNVSKDLTVTERGLMEPVKQDLAELSLQGDRVASDLKGIFGQAFDRFLVRGRDARNVLNSLERDLLRLGNHQLGGIAQSGGGGFFTTLISGAGDFLSQVFPGFAGGGQFNVGGAAGKDRNLVGLRLSRGEQVTIETPSQQKTAVPNHPNQTVNLAFNISTPDIAGFQRSQSQIQEEALRSAQRILRRNGSSL